MKKDKITQARIAHASAYSATELSFLKRLDGDPGGQTAMWMGECQWGVAPARARAAQAGAVLHRLRRLGLAQTFEFEGTKLWQITPDGIKIIKEK